MAQAIPLVRAIAMLPALRWLERQDYPVERLLARNSLSSTAYCNPMRPIPHLKVGAALRDIARDFGPDAACRIVAETDELDLFQVGRVALGARTPAEALARISFGLPYFCSHEWLNLETSDTAVVIRHSYGARFDAETHHLMSQYALAVLDRVCAMTGAATPRTLRVELPPHPDAGVAHLERWFGVGVVFGTGKGVLTATLARNVAERPFARQARDRSAELARLNPTPLRNGGGFAETVRILLAAMIEDEDVFPTVADVADAAGLSVRTFQRRMNEENGSFKALLDEVREERARALIADGRETITSVSTRLGYARPTSLNRSMLRWTGRSPTSYRGLGS